MNFPRPGVVVCAFFALAVQAVQAANAADPLPEPLKACTSLKRDSERLVCYDRAIAQLRSGDVVTPAPSAENMFGATPDTSNSSAASSIEREELRQITAQIVSLKYLKDGALVLTLNNAQIWRQQDSDTLLSFKKGDSLTITRASLGTFRVTDTRGRSARFKRLR